MTAFETIEVNALEVVCDGLPTPERSLGASTSGEVTGSGFAQAGGGGALGHPRVFLHIDQDKGEITCPYCSRNYVLKLLAGVHSGSH